MNKVATDIIVRLAATACIMGHTLLVAIHFHEPAFWPYLMLLFASALVFVAVAKNVD